MREVEISREKIIIPTYLHAPAEKTPMFYELRNNQGTRGNVYPYPMIDKLTDEIVDKEYDSIRIENEYTRVVVLPELGGRIYEGYDKVNDYNFVYKNNVIKPALIGLLGAWVSGGIEFNWPQHHRPTTFVPVDAEIEENPDGSKTAWVGEIELLTGTKGMVGVTLYPGKSFIQAKARIYNRTSAVQTFHWWANLAVHTNEDYKLIFPPDVDYITTHYKPSVSTFPRLSGVYMGRDYGDDGPDVSWYKNVENSASFFIFNSNYSFMSGYDCGKQKGTVHVADRYVSPGKKFFTWGRGSFGDAWQRNLTDNDGPYIEIMTGCYTDNQPDFTFIQPFETKTFEQNWYGLRAMPNLVNASTEGAISLAVENGEARFAVNSTSARNAAKVKLTVKGSVVFEKQIDIAPDKPWNEVIPVGGDTKLGDVSAFFMDADDKEIISYHKLPYYFEGKGAPAAHPPGRKPQDIETIEELYLEGLQVEQYRHPTWDPDPFYKEALRRDPGDARCNNAVGIRCMKKADFCGAAKHFRLAVKRLTMRNPNPYDSEPYFNLGTALMQLSEDGEALEALKKAAWSYAWRAPSLEQCAVIHMRAGNWGKALTDAEEAYKTNTQSLHLRFVMSAALRKLGRPDEAVKLCEATNKMDRLDYAARYESYLLTGDAETKKELYRLMSNRIASWLALSGDYLEAGLYGEALDILDDCPESPMKYYYTAYIQNKLGLSGGGEIAKGDGANPDYCFPSTNLDIKVLENARAEHGGGLAPYLLGLVYYARHNDDCAIACFEEAVNRDDDNYAAHRCLAHAYYDKRNDSFGAKNQMEKAFSQNRTARYLLELNQLYKVAGIKPEERLKLLNDNIDLVDKRDDLYMAYVSLLNTGGQFELAAAKLSSHIFHPYEGGEGLLIGEHIRAYIALGRKARSSGDHNKALELFKTAVEYPANYNEGYRPNVMQCLAYYEIAMTYKSTGDSTGYVEWLQKACGVDLETDESGYYKGLALRESGQASQAQALYERMLRAADETEALGDSFPYFTGFPIGLAFEQSKKRINQVKSRTMRYYANLGLGRAAEAAAAKKALDEMGVILMTAE